MLNFTENDGQLVATSETTNYKRYWVSSRMLKVFLNVEFGTRPHAELVNTRIFSTVDEAKAAAIALEGES